MKKNNNNKASKKFVRWVEDINLADQTFRTAIFIFVVLIFQLLMTVIFPVGPTSVPKEIYTRNYSSIIALIIMGIFCLRYYFFHSRSYNPSRDMKFLKISALVAAVAGLVKIGISIFFAVPYLINKNMVGLYYIGEILMWGSLSMFLIGYYLKLNKSHRTKLQ